MKKSIYAFFLTAILAVTLTVSNGVLASNINNFQQKEDTKLKITNKPKPKPSTCQESSAVVLLKVTFDKSATITNAEIARTSGCDDLDSNSLEAARAIEFKPQTKNGEPITVTKTVEYSYTKY
jgi:TonB family protein